VRHVVGFSVLYVNVVFHNRQIRKREWSKVIDKIIVISANVDNLCIVFLPHFHYDFEKIGVFLFPFAFATLLQMPSIDDIAIHNQGFAIDCTQEIG
jgi:hypothetical protein